MTECTAFQNPALDLSNDNADNGEISGEFGDSTSLAGSGGRPGDPPVMVTSELAVPPLPEMDEVPARTARERFSLVQGNHVKALIWKNFLWMYRNPSAMLFIIGLPILQIFNFNVAIGHDPFDLKMAVVNHELNRTDASMAAHDYGRLFDQSCDAPTTCNYSMLSCRYLGFLKNRRILYELYDSEEAVEQQVESGRAWGSIMFAANYSDAMFERSTLGRFVEDVDLEQSMVNVRLDRSSEFCFRLFNHWICFSYISPIHTQTSRSARCCGATSSTSSSTSSTAC